MSDAILLWFPFGGGRITVIIWRGSKFFRKAFAKVRQIGITYLSANIINFQVCMQQQIFCFFHADIFDIAVDAASGFFDEQCA